MNKFTCSSEVRTHVGNVRSHNEDAAIARDNDGLWVVADGMGGHQAGDYASSAIVSAMGKLSLRAYLVDLVEQVEDNLSAVNSELINYANEAFASASKVGSTVACLIIRYGVAVAVWSGDSRIYLWRDNKLMMMTRDHTKVQELLDQGHLTPQQAEQSNLKNMLTRAVGVHDDFFVDINAFSIRHGDRFLVCSDGLYNEIDDPTIERIIQTRKIKKIADNLLARALAGDARDNVTLIVVEVN